MCGYQGAQAIREKLVCQPISAKSKAALSHSDERLFRGPERED